MDRRTFITGASSLALGATAARAQHQHAPLPQASPSPEPFTGLRTNAPHHISPDEQAQRVTESPAPQDAPGRWVTRAALPLPRSEMAWATEWAGRAHIVGGYGEGRVDRTYHHIYDPAKDVWFDGAPLPRGANHVAVAAMPGVSTRLAASSSRTAIPITTPTPMTSPPIAGTRSRRCHVRVARAPPWC